MMRWALDLIANMPGPKFLGFYLAACALVLLASWWAVRRRGDEATTEVAGLLPTKPDPYFIAFLNGGAAAVAQLAVFELTRKGLLRQQPRTPRQEEFAPTEGTDGQAPTKIEQESLDWFAGSARTPQEIFRKKDGLPARLLETCEPFRISGLERGLLTSPEQSQQAIAVAAAGLALICGLGLFKLIAALSSNHTNVGGLIIIGMLGSIGVVAACITPRLTRAGKRFIGDLRLAHGQLQEGWSRPDAPTTAPALALSLFGPAILVGTPFASCGTLFQQYGAAAGAGGCGSSSVGGTCSSGDGCGGGGGCGGCGGD